MAWRKQNFPRCGHNVPGFRRSRVTGGMLAFCLRCDHEWPVLESVSAANGLWDQDVTK